MIRGIMCYEVNCYETIDVLILMIRLDITQLKTCQINRHGHSTMIRITNNLKLSCNIQTKTNTMLTLLEKLKIQDKKDVMKDKKKVRWKGITKVKLFDIYSDTVGANTAFPRGRYLFRKPISKIRLNDKHSAVPFRVKYIRKNNKFVYLIKGNPIGTLN